jgi:prephenate dehydrogenase
MKSVGIIGLGSFGRFMATLVPKGVEVWGSSRSVTELEGVKIKPLEEVVKADVLLLGFPLNAYPTMLAKVAPLLPPETLVVDVCSVKVKPEELLAKYLPQHTNILSTHPLFGPQSAANGTKGHKLVVTKNNGDEKAEKLLQYCAEKLELDISTMTAEEHDRIMARVHALTFFVSRGLAEMNLRKEQFMTPSYQRLLDMVEFDKSHSQELFDTIENGNPFAAAARQEFMHTLKTINARLKKDAIQ